METRQDVMAQLELHALLHGPSNTADQLRSGAPVRLAGGGTGRHLSLPNGCRPELRQLHPLVLRPHGSASEAGRQLSVAFSHLGSELSSGNCQVVVSRDEEGC
jgi:hypothetical protein